MHLPDPWQKFLSASKPKNSAPSEQLVGFAHEHSVAHASWLLGAQSAMLGSQQVWSSSHSSDVASGLGSFTPTVKIHFKCYLL